MAHIIVPTARSIFLCDYHFSSHKDKDDLYGVCTAFRVEQFPHRIRQLCVFAQLSNGLGRMSVHIDIRQLSSGKLIHWTHPQFLYFQTRSSMIRLVMNIQDCDFPKEGLYAVELFCDNVWVGDTVLEAIEESD